MHAPLFGKQYNNVHLTQLMNISVNRKAWNFATKLCDAPEEYGVTVKKTKMGATIIDAGINSKGGFQAGKIITEICLGGYGSVEVFPAQYDDITLPSIFVRTDYPAISTLGSQFADWRIKARNYSAIGSGPARALAQKNRELYDKIGYVDDADAAVLVLETSKEPDDQIVEQVSKECRVMPEWLMLILVPTTSVAGSIQISGRIVETGLHKLMQLGLDPKMATHASGWAPIAPVHPKFAEAMGRTNDAILYAGVTHYDVINCKDEELKELIKRAPSSASKSYGKPFSEIFKEVNYDFYKIDPNLFAPAVLTINNVETGNVFRAGKVNVEVLKCSIGLSN
jgi:methenyltetrahydromethanopterin cyclohydrolase